MPFQISADFTDAFLGHIGAGHGPQCAVADFQPPRHLAIL